MKRSLLLILLVFVLTQCKENKQPKPLPEIEGLVSVWKMTRIEVKRYDSTMVEIAPDRQPLTFRYDGIPVDEKGQKFCCPPKSYVLNGVRFEIKETSDAPPYNPQCSFVDCIGCAEWDITQKGDEMTINYCGTRTATFSRVK